MTTSVFYGAELRLVDLATTSLTAAGNASVKTIYDNLSSYLDTGITLVQQINNSASTTNPNATFTNTPTNGNAMIAIVMRGDNQASTNANWTLLTSQGATGARRLEMWWRRAGASESKTHTWTNATAALWDVTLIEFGGFAAYVDPVVVQAAQNATTTTTASFTSTGILESVCAVATSGGSAGTFTNTGTNTESVTDLPFTTTTRFRAMTVDGWLNRPKDQTNVITYTTSRPHTRAQVGWNLGSETQNLFATYGPQVGNTAQTTADALGQIGLRFDTSALPNNDTIDSATLTLKSGIFGSVWPANCALNAYSLAAASISASNSNTRAVWKKPSELAALTRIATRAAGSAWVINTAYNWTSDSAFLTELNKTGNTTLVLATADQQAGTYRTTEQTANFSSTASDHYITVVHSPPAQTVAASVTVTPTLTRVASFARSIAASLTVTPGITQVLSFARTVASSVTTSPTISQITSYLRTISSDLTVTPVLTATRSLLRTIATTIDLTSTILATKIPFVSQVARVIRLGGRNTIRIGQITVARITGRTTIRAPKE
jgi:hypothetical protein